MSVDYYSINIIIICILLWENIKRTWRVNKINKEAILQKCCHFINYNMITFWSQVEFMSSYLIIVPNQVLLYLKIIIVYITNLENISYTCTF